MQLKKPVAPESARFSYNLSIYFVHSLIEEHLMIQVHYNSFSHTIGHKLLLTLCCYIVTGGLMVVAPTHSKCSALILFRNICNPC